MQSKQVDPLAEKDFLPPRYGNIPWDQFDQWHVDGLIEEVGDIREDLGTYKRLLEMEGLSKENENLIQKLIVLDKNRMKLIVKEVQGYAKNGQEDDTGGASGVRRPGQGSFFD